MQLLLEAAGDMEVGVGHSSRGVRVGTASDLPNASVGCSRSRIRLTQWRSSREATGPGSGTVVQLQHSGTISWEFCATKARVGRLEDDGEGSEETHRTVWFTARVVLFDGTKGISVNSHTRMRDQERAPIASDLKRDMRAEVVHGESTLALTADVTCRTTHTHV